MRRTLRLSLPCLRKALLEADANGVLQGINFD